MNGHSIASFAKKACWAAIIGSGGSILVNTVRRDRKRAERLLLYTTVSGLSVLGVACTYAAFKNQSVLIFPTSSKLFLISGTFFVLRDNLVMSSKTREWRRKWEERQGRCFVLPRREAMTHMSASALSGGITSFLMSLAMWRGFAELPIKVLQGVFIGAGGEWLVEKCRIWILEECIRYQYPELVANAKANKESIDERWMRRRKAKDKDKNQLSQNVNDKIHSLEIQLEILEEDEARLLQRLQEENGKVYQEKE